MAGLFGGARMAPGLMQPTIGSQFLGVSPSDYNTLGASLKDALAYFSGRPEMANNLQPAMQQGQQAAQQEALAAQYPALVKAVQSGNTGALDSAMAGSPALALQLGPDLLSNAITAQQKASEPYTLTPGSSRFVGDKQIANVPVTPNPNQPFNRDGTPNKAFQEYEMAKMKAQQAPQWANVALARQKLQVENPFQGGQNSFGPGALAAAPLATQSTVKAMIEGRMAPPSSMALRTPYWQNMLALANSADPTFDQTEWGARANARKDFTGGGKSYQMLNSGNTVIQHLGRLNNQISDVAGTSVPVLNSVENFTAMHTGRPGVNAYNDTLGHLAEETTKFYRGTGGNEDDIKRTMENLSPNLSAAQKQSGVANTVHLIYGKLQPMVEQYNKTMGTNFPPSHFLSKEAVNTMKGMGYDPDTGEKVNGGGAHSGRPKTIKFGDLP